MIQDIAPKEYNNHYEEHGSLTVKFIIMPLNPL